MVLHSGWPDRRRQSRARTPPPNGGGFCLIGRTLASSRGDNGSAVVNCPQPVSPLCIEGGQQLGSVWNPAALLKTT